MRELEHRWIVYPHQAEVGITHRLQFRHKISYWCWPGEAYTEWENVPTVKYFPQDFLKELEDLRTGDNKKTTEVLGAKE